MAKIAIGTLQVSRAVPSLVVFFFFFKHWQFFLTEIEGIWDEATCFYLVAAI